ncbi:TPA: DNA translocase FtsK [Vibrio cholerae]
MLGSLDSSEAEYETSITKLEQRCEDLLEDAIAFVKETRRASVSALQRKFKIGFNHAARIMERMEEMNIVSKPAHNGNREVLAPPIA